MGELIPITRRPRYGGHPCGYLEMLKSMPEVERNKVLAAMAGKRSASEVSAWLRTDNHFVGPDTINKHRRGDCQTCIRAEAEAA